MAWGCWFFLTFFFWFSTACLPQIVKISVQNSHLKCKLNSSLALIRNPLLSCFYFVSLWKPAIIWNQSQILMDSDWIKKSNIDLNILIGFRIWLWFLFWVHSFVFFLLLIITMTISTIASRQSQELLNLFTMSSKLTTEARFPSFMFASNHPPLYFGAGLSPDPEHNRKVTQCSWMISYLNIAPTISIPCHCVRTQYGICCIQTHKIGIFSPYFL